MTNPSETKLVETPRSDAFAWERLQGPAQTQRYKNHTEWAEFARQLERELAAAQTEIAGLNGIIRVRTSALASLADELRLARERCARLTELLQDAKGNLIWCGGSADFGPNGQAKIGYDKGPRRTIAEIDAALKESR